MSINLDAIKDRLAAATPGPWFGHADDLIGGWCVRTVDTPPSEGPGEVASFIREEDADLIANAPTDLAALIAEVDWLRPQVSFLRASVPPTHPSDYGYEAWTETIRAAEARGRNDERARIVADLRSAAPDADRVLLLVSNPIEMLLRACAERYERGDHEKRP
jgi:hypothetical protein